MGRTRIPGGYSLAANRAVLVPTDLPSPEAIAVKWLELSVVCPREFVEPLSQLFHSYGRGGVAVEEGGGFNPDEGETPPDGALVTVRTYLPVDQTTEDRRNRIDLGVRLVSHLSPGSRLRERVIDQDEWQDAWKKHFDVLKIGRRIVVVPTWRSYEPRGQDVIVRLDPGMAFGTGHHPTTRMCLEQAERLVKPGMKVLDAGCGSGILSIAAARLGALAVVGVEIDSVAAGVARVNAEENRVENVVHVYEGTLPRPEVSSGSFDVAMANISARVVSELAEHLVAAVKPAGSIVVSGILEKDRDLVAARLSDCGAQMEAVFADGDWVTLVALVSDESS